MSTMNEINITLSSIHRLCESSIPTKLSVRPIFSPNFYFFFFLFRSIFFFFFNNPALINTRKSFRWFAKRFDFGNCSWSPSLRMSGETGQLRDFIEDLGPGQVVGRQALGARCLGEIQLSLSQKKGFLEVEVIRAKDLKPKQGTKAIPGSFSQFLDLLLLFAPWIIFFFLFLTHSKIEASLRSRIY